MAAETGLEWQALVRKRVAGLRLDPATEAEVVDELAQHVSDAYHDAIARGLEDASARAAALRELDGHPRLAREISSLRSVPMAPLQDFSRSRWTALVDDVVYAFKRLRHSPGFAAVAIATVMLTVGANTAILSVADAVLFRPLPYADPEQIAVIQVMNKSNGKQYTMTPYSFLQAVNDGCPSVSEVGLLEDAPSFFMETPDGRMRVPAMTASPNYFDILGARPETGRLLGPQDTGREGRAAVLSYAAWKQLYGGDPSIVGRSVTLGAATIDIVGVLPRDFIFPSVLAGRPSVVLLRKSLDGNEKGGTFHAIVRVAHGTTLDRAQAEVAVAASPISASTKGREDSVPFLNPARAILYPVGQPVMRYLLAASGLILLLGCANLANLLLVRGRRRIRETAMRLALGADRLRLIRPIVFEAVIVGVIGAGLAVLVTALTFDVLIEQVPAVAYGRAPVGVSARVIGASMAMGLIASLIFSFVPAWRSARIDVLALIQRRGTRRRSRPGLGRPMVGAQVAISVAVIFGAAIATRAFVEIASIDLGFSPNDVVSVSVGLPQSTTDRQQAYADLAAQLGKRADVNASAVVGAMPFSRSAPDAPAFVANSPKPIAPVTYALPGYFETSSIRFVLGRGYTWAELQADANLGVVSESAARLMFPGTNPVGGTFTDGANRTFRVTGVVADVRTSFSQPIEPAVYFAPYAATGVMHVLVRMRDHRNAALSELKADVRRILPGSNPVVEWWSDTIQSDPAYRDPRFQTIVFVALAVLALGLTALGIFSVMSYVVSARTREMGVRLAIGASPASLVALVVRQSLLPVALGIGAGLIVAKWGGRLAEAQFFKVNASDPAMLGLAVATVVLASLLAAYLPARRATRINPSEVLKAE